MPKKKTIEEVSSIFENRGLHLCETEYKNNRTKMTCYDNDDYYYSLSLGNIMDLRTKWFEKVNIQNPYTIQNIDRFIENNGYHTKVISTQYLGEKEELKCQCECGEIYITCWNHINQMGKFTCTKCGRKRTALKQTYSIEYAESICKENGFDLIKESYIDAHNLSILDKDGYKYKTTLYNISNGLNKFDKFEKFNPYTIYNMNRYIELNELPIEMVDKTERQIEVKKDYIDFYCIDCGEIFSATWQQIVYDHRYRCRKCSLRESNNEMFVRKYLEELDVEFEQEKRFDDCCIKRKLPFDFYIPSINYVIEVHGQQHYYESPMFKQPLKERQEIDLYKKNYCEQHGIGYLEIPYWFITQSKTETYKTMIDNILKKD